MAISTISSNNTAVAAECANLQGDKNHKMNVFFRFVDGQTLCLWLDPNLEIRSIKQALVAHKAAQSSNSSSNSKGSPTLVWAARDLFLVWNGKLLDEAALLSDYGVKQQSQHVTIHVSYRNRGGCFMVSCSILAVICASLLGSFCTCGASLLVVPVLLPLLFILPLFCL